MIAHDLPIEKLHPHPDNPRKDVGDVTELAESIKKNGVLQNLTVVPDDASWENFTVIIGHRRLAAAKLAGISELPCVIIEMNEKEQMSTMLTENMQRTDLTVYEQGQGFQMLIDLGDSISDIAKKTAFSESTIRRRLKLTELDEEAFRESQTRQPSLEDYEKLNVIKDINKRNELLSQIGTKNFENALTSAKQEQIREENKAQIIASMEGFADYIDDIRNVPLNYTYVGNIGINDIDSFKQSHNDGREYAYYIAFRGDSVGIYMKPSKDEISSKSKIEETNRILRQKSRELQDKIKEIDDRRKELVVKFISSPIAAKRVATNFEAKNSVIKYICEEFANHSYSLYYNKTILTEILNFSYDENKCINFDDCVAGNKIGTLLLATAYSILRGNYSMSYISITWDDNKATAVRNINQNLNKFYYVLRKCGYEMSDEEKQLRDGTHPIFFKEDSVNDN
ncbi:ParB/RepB/Spo0J family partition protein [Ruminococcus sp.]|uniref:ParB/RepB/Spo0J family partition protein n=1 Tax=Ruminococcus sp. TaxID=41978 RepID=UPI003AB17DDB